MHPLSLDFLKTAIDNGGRRYLSMMVRYYMAGSWNYKFILLELPGLWNVTFTRTYNYTGQYTPYWLPDITVTYVDTLSFTVHYYVREKYCARYTPGWGCTAWKYTWREVYNGTDDLYPIAYNGTDVFINTTPPLVLYHNITIDSIISNQPVWIEYINYTGTNSTTIFPGHRDNLNISIRVDKIERTIDNKYHYVVRIIIPYNSSALLRLYTKGTIRIEGYGVFNDTAEILVGYSNKTLDSGRLELDSLGLPIAYAADEGVVLDITADNEVNVSLVKVITNYSEYIINKTITLKGETLTYIQSLYNKYGLLLVAVPIIFILLILLALAAGRRRR